MKKVLFVLALILMAAYNSIYASIIANPIISRGKPVYTSSGNASYLVDNKFNTTTWTVKDSSWIAIKVDSGPSKVFVNWNNPHYYWSNELTIAKCRASPPLYFPVDYNLLTSSNSTNGSDGVWKIADSIRGNIVCTRGHLIDFTGAKWVKMDIIKGGGNLDEVEVFDASYGIEDSWFFVGTSISANAFKATPPIKDYADIVNNQFPKFNPVMIRGGIACISSTDFVNNLSKYLNMAGNIKYWAIEMGTNDAWDGGNGNVPIFKQNLQRVIDSCKSRGIHPIIARILATNPIYTVNHWQINYDFEKAIDSLTKDNNLIAGPDFFTWFLAHPEEINGGTDGVHPNAVGAASIQRLWAEKMAPLYGGCATAEITPYVKVNKNELKLVASASLKQYDTILLSPQVPDTGSWLWSGPSGFSALTQEVTINNIQVNQAGSYIASYTRNDTCTSTYTFKLKVKAVIEIKPIDESSNDIGVFPNPSVEGKFKISINNFSGNSLATIYDMQGKLAFQQVLTSKDTELDTGLEQGIYLLRIVQEKNIYNQKIIIK